MPDEQDTLVARRSPEVALFKTALWSYDGEAGALIPLLQAAQESYGYVPESAIDAISETTGIPPADIYGVITFYAQFRLRPLGRYLVKVCDGTACHVNGSRAIINAVRESLRLGAGDTTEDGLFTLQQVACLGCCSLSPAIMINEETYGRLTQKKIQQILKEYARKKPGENARRSADAESAPPGNESLRQENEVPA